MQPDWKWKKSLGPNGKDFIRHSDASILRDRLNIAAIAFFLMGLDDAISRRSYDFLAISGILLAVAGILYWQSREAYWAFKAKTRELVESLDRKEVTNAPSAEQLPRQ